MKTIRFELPVTYQIPFTNQTDTFMDAGILMLPDSYSESGEPTRLVVNCHGAGGTVSTDDSQVEHQVLSMYLLANGYAIMDTNGLPYRYCSEYGVDDRNNIGSPLAMDCYVNAYRYCMDHFNLKPEVFVHGGSMGGISSTNLVLSGRIPVLAQTAFCPVLDSYHHIYLHPWSAGLPKTALGILYSLEKDETGEWIYDEEKLKNYNPAVSTVKHPCPVWYCHCDNDDIVNPAPTKAYIARAQAQGVEAELLPLPDGLHEPQSYGDPVTDPIGISVFEGTPLVIPIAVEGAFRWIRSHEPQ